MSRKRFTGTRSAPSAASEGRRPPRALLTATVLSHIAQFHQPAIDLLKQSGFEVHVAARNNLSDKPGLTLSGVDRIVDVPFERRPLSLKNIAAARCLRRVLRETNYDLIHCNTPVAGMLTRLLAHSSRRHGAKVVYTAHGFHFYKGAPVQNWLLYFPLEWLFAWMTDVLVTINREDWRRAQHFPAKTIEYVPGVGVDLGKFRAPMVARGDMRARLGLPSDAFVVLSIGELNDNKNHQTVLRAIAEMADTKVQYVICGEGPRRAALRELTEDLGVSDRVHLLGYRRDIPDLLALADIFCLPSYREGLPLSVMEAMAAGKPVVCSRIRGVVDLVDATGGRLVDGCGEPSEFAAAFGALASCLADLTVMGQRNMDHVREFSIDAVRPVLASVYELGAVAEARKM